MTQGEVLVELTRGTQYELVLCAPFIKRHVAERLFEALEAKPRITIITRWRPEEVAAGVSDLDVFALVKERAGRLLLVDRLHAKYFRADDRALLGSANLTGAALGWHVRPNLELMVETDPALPMLREFEQTLLAEGVDATQDLAEAIAAAAELLPSSPSEESDSSSFGEPHHWLPQLREPRDLQTAYEGRTGRFTEISQRAAQHDLAALDLPPGLSVDAIRAVVSSRLAQAPTIVGLNAFLATPRRFGEVRDKIERDLALPSEQATETWQTLIRWLLHFSPTSYRYIRPRHTELFQYVRPE